jgi:hypothetical protein
MPCRSTVSREQLGALPSEESSNAQHKAVARCSRASFAKMQMIMSSQKRWRLSSFKKPFATSQRPAQSDEATARSKTRACGGTQRRSPPHHTRGETCSWCDPKAATSTYRHGTIVPDPAALREPRDETLVVRPKGNLLHITFRPRPAVGVTRRHSPPPASTGAKSGRQRPKRRASASAHQEVEHLREAESQLAVLR